MTLGTAAPECSRSHGTSPDEFARPATELVTQTEALVQLSPRLHAQSGPQVHAGPQRHAGSASRSFGTVD